MAVPARTRKSPGQVQETKPARSPSAADGQQRPRLRLYGELPDQEQVLGTRDPETLNTRAHIAFLSGQCGDPGGALRLFRDQLPEQEQVLGTRHPAAVVRIAT